ncbi:MAG TPA: DNA mismatch repair endonuclease MutH [Polyangiaceae bacterium]|nr:DNA mismatch repair endonuclease MutH [Polyangiaceae bacterium]
MFEPKAAPRSELELLARARALAGVSLGELALQFGVSVPESQLRAKGWVGQLLERALGATAGSRAKPDFEGLGIELKTLPVDARGKPKESTFVCTIALTEIGEVEWEHSRVRRKLARVLWVPVEAEASLPFAGRRFGEPLLWSPDSEEEAELRFDWEELAGRIGMGELERITGHFGKHLQVRPKAAHSRVRRRGIDEDGAYVEAPPRGFYLRPSFTLRLLRKYYAAPARA